LWKISTKFPNPVKRVGGSSEPATLYELMDDDALVPSVADRARLVEYRDVLDRLVLELLERETLNQSELVEIFAPVVKRPPREVWLSSEERAVSSRPPVMTPRELADLAATVSQNGHIEVAPEPDEKG